MKIEVVTPESAQHLLGQGARLVDVRAPDEFARSRITGAINIPLDRLESLPGTDQPIIFQCRSGMRTASHAQRLAAATQGPCYILEGGIDGWRACGLPVELNAGQPIEIMRQVQMAAGTLVLAGLLLGLLVAPPFFAVTAFVGGGLIFAGASGWCGMATLLRHMPWNRQMRA